MSLNLRVDIENAVSQSMSKQNRCAHIWWPVCCTQDVVNEPVYETHFEGSRCFPVQVSTKLVLKDRYYRRCKKCGKVEYCSHALLSKISRKLRGN